ncbi:hypothetical protein F385_3975 [Pantoea agglomerans 299R]|nr:hypothetical protein F385_3975 [Pantoea agglomerans 299R]
MLIDFAQRLFKASNLISIIVLARIRELSFDRLLFGGTPCQGRGRMSHSQTKW